jgi:LacI family transcriptional regulator
LQRNAPPYILTNRQPVENTRYFIGCDDRTIGFLATEHLIKIGCKRIAHIREPKNSAGDGRLKGYKKALLRHGMEMHEEYLVDGRMADIDGRQSGAAATQNLINLRRIPDGIKPLSEKTFS